MPAAERSGSAVNRRMSNALAAAGLAVLASVVALAVQAMPQFDAQSASKLGSVMRLESYNTRIVVAGVSLLGLAAGTIGTFLLLRRRSLTADALSHATLPGIALAFIVAVILGYSGKHLFLLLGGAFVFGLIGMGMIIAIRNTTRIKDDAALGIVLSVFFGLGTSLIKVAESLPGGSAAGLDRFILGRAASMISSDAVGIFWATLVITIVSAFLFKEFRLLCFDQGFAESQGWPVIGLDALLMGLVTAVTVVGLQSVGLVLVVALLITPAAAARFWTDRLRTMTIVSACIGLLSGYFGAVASAMWPKVPTGPVIVLVCSAVFLFSLIFGVRRGLLMRIVRSIGLGQRVGMQNLMRAMWELSEPHEAGRSELNEEVRYPDLLGHRTWSRRSLRWQLWRAKHSGLVFETYRDGYKLSRKGWSVARRVVRNHRLWEVYLITHAEIAPSHVDRDADHIEHILNPELIDKLESLLAERFPQLVMPESPHHIRSGKAG